MMDESQIDPALLAQIIGMQDPAADPAAAATKQQMTRQRALTAGLRGRAMDGMQGQMVGRHYVAPSAAAQVANMATTGMSLAQDRKLDQQAEGLASAEKQVGQQNVATKQGYMNALLKAMRARGSGLAAPGGEQEPIAPTAEEYEDDPFAGP